jgi:hypothetical protein
MKLIAVHTIHGRKVMRAPIRRMPRTAAAIDRDDRQAGEEFDTAEFGIDDDEAQS